LPAQVAGRKLPVRVRDAGQGSPPRNRSACRPANGRRNLAVELAARINIERACKLNNQGNPSASFTGRKPPYEGASRHWAGSHSTIPAGRALRETLHQFQGWPGLIAEGINSQNWRRGTALLA